MAAASEGSGAASCPCDGELMPRWRGPEVMDDDSQAMGFVCQRCGREYLPVKVRNRKLLAPRIPTAG